MVTTIQMDTATAMIPGIPAPNQTMTMGASAVLGSALRTTRKGSRMRERMGFHQSSVAMAIPENVPMKKPAKVSSMVMPIWRQMVPLEK